MEYPDSQTTAECTSPLPNPIPYSAKARHGTKTGISEHDVARRKEVGSPMSTGNQHFYDLTGETVRRSKNSEA